MSLPDGTYHGGLATTDVPALAAALAAGHVLPSHLRGRAGLPAPVQAAEHHLREHLGLLGLDAVRPLGPHTVDQQDTGWTELLTRDGARYRVGVRPRACDRPRLTSCAGTGTTGTPVTFELVGLVELLDPTRESTSGREGPKGDAGVSGEAARRSGGGSGTPR